MAEKDPTSPATTSYAYDVMAPLWEKLDTLLAGTDAMRAAGQQFLPQHQEEGVVAYNERLSRATLLNMLQFTLDSWVGRPFNKPVGSSQDVPTQIKDLFDDIDLQGNNLDVFAREWFRDGLVKGFSHVLADFPKPKARPDGQPRTLADDRAEKLRPYLCHVRPENLIFAYAEVTEGVEKLLHVRIRETESVLNGFSEQIVNRIKVIEPGVVTIYEEQYVKKTKKIKWVQIDTWNYDLKFIPLVTFYADKQGFMLAKPPLADLADLNIRHWQSTSDQIAVLTVARFPILAVSGAIDEDKLIVGPNQWLNTPDPAGRFYYVEHTGAAIAAGRNDLLDLEEQMAQYGAVFLKRRPGGASATARALDSAETTSPLQDMAIRFRDALGQAMQFMALWLKLPTGGAYVVTTDFGLTDEGGVKLKALQEARLSGDLSRKRLCLELKRFGVLSQDFEFTVNEAELKVEPPPISRATTAPSTAPEGQLVPIPAGAPTPSGNPAA